MVVSRDGAKEEKAGPSSPMIAGAAAGCVVWYDDPLLAPAPQPRIEHFAREGKGGKGGRAWCCMSRGLHGDWIGLGEQYAAG